MTLDEYLDLPNLKNITSSTVDLSNLTSAYSIENNGKSNPFMSDEVLNLRFQAVSTNESVPQRAVICYLKLFVSIFLDFGKFS